MSAEFDIISRYFKRDMSGHDTVVLGVGDDAAIIKPTAGTELVITIDTLVEGVHFAGNDDAYDVGYKLAAVNLSDLAAMGAAPRWATLALTLPDIDDTWLGSFADGLYYMLDEFNVALVGGDTTAGQLTVSLQMAGEIPAGSAIRRDGASPGDNIYVSGTLGDAGLALRVREGEIQVEELEGVFLEERLCWPSPRVELGQALRRIASSAIDVSDGLLADLGHILEASHAGAEIQLENLPLSDVMRQYMGQQWEIPLASGDDYELCFTAAVDNHDAVMRAADSAGVQVSHVGQVVAGDSARCFDANGKEYVSEYTGYEHFYEYEDQVDNT